MAKTTTEKEWAEIVVKNGVNRCVKVTKGARQFSYSAVVVVGDRQGTVGFGFGKAREVPMAVEKALKNARKSLHKIPLKGTTIPHEVVAKYGASKVMLRPASPGTGLVAGASVRAVAQAVGIEDLIGKAYGSTNPLNLVKATMQAMRSLRSKQQVEQLRGVELE